MTKYFEGLGRARTWANEVNYARSMHGLDPLVVEASETGWTVLNPGNTPIPGRAEFRLISDGIFRPVRVDAIVGGPVIACQCGYFLIHHKACGHMQFLSRLRDI